MIRTITASLYEADKSYNELMEISISGNKFIKDIEVIFTDNRITSNTGGEINTIHNYQANTYTEDCKVGQILKINGVDYKIKDIQKYRTIILNLEVV